MTTENEVFMYEPSGMVCTRSFDTVVSKVLPSDSMTVVGTPARTPGSETLPDRDMCCTVGDSMNNPDLLMACINMMTQENSMHVWNPAGNMGSGECKRIYEEVSTNTLPSNNNVVGTPVRTDKEQIETKDECCVASGVETNPELRNACETFN